MELRARAAACLTAGLVACGGGSPEDDASTPATAPGAPRAEEAAEGTSAATRPRQLFTDVTEASGVAFAQGPGANGRWILAEIMGGGVALFDMDGDGDRDAFLVQSGSLVKEARGEHRLYENDGTGRFEDVTDAVGLTSDTYGMGVAVGDYDEDGRVDLFTTGVGGNRLYRNAGERFEDVTDVAGVLGSEGEWTTSAGFFDADGDGDLDLFVCHYVRWSPEIDREIAYTLNGEDRAYGPPMNYAGTTSTLFRNECDGTFVDVSEAAGIQVKNAATGAPMGKALGVSFTDVDDDGRMDVLVANDTVQNHLFRGLGDGTT